MVKQFRYIIALLIFAIGLITTACAGSANDSVALEASLYETEVSPNLTASIDQMIAERKYRESIVLLQNKIVAYPKNTALKYKLASIYADLEQWNNAIATLDQLLLLHPKDEKALLLKQKMEDYKAKEPRNEVGFNQNTAYVSDLNAYWGLSSLHYYRLTDIGKVGGRVNVAFRFGTSGKQYQFEANPKITDNITANLIAGYANTTQFLFPNLMYRLDAYFTLPHDTELALGQGTSKFIRFDNQKLLLYTASLGKYQGNYFVWFRPYYYTPKHTEYNELGLRRYYSDAKNYITLLVGTGRLTDIGDLPPFDKFLTLSQNMMGIDGQFSIAKTIWIKLGANYAKQQYQTGLDRNILDGSIGITWQF